MFDWVLNTRLGFEVFKFLNNALIRTIYSKAIYSSGVIQNPAKHLRWSFLRKELTAFRKIIS